MDGLRTPTDDEIVALANCIRCQAIGCPWDRVGGQPICPDCQEMLAQGEGEPLSLHAEPRRCLVCQTKGTVSFITVPLRAVALAIDLCPIHLRALLRRGLDRKAFMELDRRLKDAGLAPGRIFLLHEAFYDSQGRALQPIRE